MFDFIATVHRYQWRAVSFAMGLREGYPPFEFTPSSADTGTDPASFSLAYPEQLSRGLPFVKWLLAVPHYVVLAVLFVGAFFAWWAGALTVLFTGRWPEGVRRYLVGVARWAARVNAYVLLLTDVYPPFALD